MQQKTISQKIFRIILIALATIGGLGIIGGGVFLYLLGKGFEEETKSTTNISRYKEIFTNFGENAPIIKHFPRTIPTDAKNVKFYFQPGFLQGGTIIRLKMTLPPEKIKSLQAEFRNKAKRKYIPGDIKNSSPQEEVSPQGIRVNFKYDLSLGDDQNSSEKVDNLPKVPSKYEILVIDDTRGAPKYDWNHSDTYGVAINISSSEVIYFADDW
ncbi:hypothetical protein [Calothrix sp. PCC 6303]|uniref:hypothetical protein n=1 Tax=Calothrix sp. PCC 6303 TaxID=1170562 RepID=UPI0002A002E3|nr:hypothetical protein [Calothrix sp. PCC 6303]AFZ02268.1 hypothetical protein Cal6303_3329 [Calothrix sp. PCC 6303]